MSLFDSMLVAHLLGDWIFQTEWQALHKAKSLAALLTHVVTYHLILLAVLLLQLPVNDWHPYAAVAVLAVTHAWLDRRANLAAFMRAVHIVRERPAEGWLLMTVDQAIHVCLLAAAAVWLTRG